MILKVVFERAFCLRSVLIKNPQRVPKKLLLSANSHENPLRDLPSIS